MRMRLRSWLAICSVFMGCCAALSAASMSVSQDVRQARPAEHAPPSRVPSTPLDSSIDGQMRSFGRHARVNMILYTGSVGPREIAAAQGRLNAVAMTLTTGR